MTEARSPTPGRPDDARSRRGSSRAFHRALIVVGVLIIAGVPLLVRGQRSANGPTPGSGSTAVASPVPGPDAGAAVPTTGVEATSPDLDLRPVVVRPGDFKCLPVKKDESVDANQYPVSPAPLSKDIFPCSRCHNKPNDFNMTPRNLTLMHLDIKLNHGPREQWCYGCHNPSKRDTLRLAGGREISFDESYELCGQCHGEKLRDWRLGIHGRRRGCWNGQREYLLCVNCHNQHSPKFKPLPPKPRPLRPSEIRLGGR